MEKKEGFCFEAEDRKQALNFWSANQLMRYEDKRLLYWVLIPWY